MTRRLLALLLPALLVLAACGGGGDDDAGGDDADGGASAPGGDAVDASLCPVDALDETSGTTSVTFWYGGLGASNVDAIEELIADYNASQERVRVRGVFQGSYDETSDKYLTTLRGGDLPDLVLLEETRIQLMIDSGSVIPADACVEASGYDLDDHLPAVLGQFRVEDVLWPMPFNTSNPVLYFDTNDFEAAGLDPADPPSSFDEVIAAARTIKESGAARTGFAVEIQPWYVEQWFAKAGEPVVDNQNGRRGRAEAALLDAEIGLEIYRFLDQLVDEDLAINVGRNESGADHLLALGNGDAAMTIGTSAALGSIYDIQEAGQFTDVGVGVAPMPGPDATDGGVQVGGGALWLVGKGKSDEAKAASWDFARWLNEPEQQARWHERTGYVPIRQSATELPEVAELWAERPTYRVAYDQLAASEARFGGPVVGPYKEFREAIQTSIERMILQGVPPEEAVTRAAEEATAAIQSYNERIGG